MSTLESLPLNARSLSYRWDGYDYRLQLDPKHLTVEWTSPAHSRVIKTALRDLKAELAVEQWVSEAGRKCTRLGTACLAAFAVVWFSDIRPHAPLLAPALLKAPAVSSRTPQRPLQTYLHLACPLVCRWHASPGYR